MMEVGTLVWYNYSVTKARGLTPFIHDSGKWHSSKQHIHTKLIYTREFADSWNPTDKILSTVIAFTVPCKNLPSNSILYINFSKLQKIALLNQPRKLQICHSLLLYEKKLWHFNTYLHRHWTTQLFAIITWSKRTTRHKEQDESFKYRTETVKDSVKGSPTKKTAVFTEWGWKFDSANHESNPEELFQHRESLLSVCQPTHAQALQNNSILYFEVMSFSLMMHMLQSCTITSQQFYSTPQISVQWNEFSELYVL